MIRFTNVPKEAYVAFFAYVETKKQGVLLEEICVDDEGRAHVIEIHIDEKTGKPKTSPFYLTKSTHISTKDKMSWKERCDADKETVEAWMAEMIEIHRLEDLVNTKEKGNDKT